jgi:hypothetical protein
VSTETSSPAPGRAGLDLFLISLLILFLELACIRWFPAHVLFLTFFTNVVLLACFVGMSVGCLAAGHRTRYLNGTPALLCLTLLAALLIETWLVHGGHRHLDVGNQARPQLVFFGAESADEPDKGILIPMEAIGGLFFLLIALTMVGPGQELGLALGRVPNRVQAYTLNILGSIAGIVLFAALSWLELPPFIWFLPVALGLAYYRAPRPFAGPALRVWGFSTVLLIVALAFTGLHWGTHARSDKDGNVEYTQYLWSPYYRIDYELPPDRMIGVNLIGHQKMRELDYISPEYALPHLLHRDVQRVQGQEPKPFENILIIGAGSGNDVSRALQWGVGHIDAVEIDPVILRLGQKDHPMQPYQQTERVSVYLDDGRNFLRSSTKKYDLIVYALVDSLVLHSSYSNIRLESYLFTRQAFEDIKKHLNPGGMFVTYNYFRQGFIVTRLYQGLEEVFGKDDPVVLTFPWQPTVEPDKAFHGFTVIFAGDTGPLKEVFQPASGPRREYWLQETAPEPEKTPNGFVYPDKADRERWAGLSYADREVQEKRWWYFTPAEVKSPSKPLRLAEDNWPFLYLQEPMIPLQPTLSGMVIMAVIALVLILLFMRSTPATGSRWSFDFGMFFLGAGFMLIETKAVVHMALLFGSTWMVNSVVFFAVLVMILLANLFVLKFRPENLWPYYLGLLLTLALNALVPLDFFLGMTGPLRIIGSCSLVFAPILFAGVIFAVTFRRTTEPDRAFGANIAGAMLGGLAENTSMLLGFQYLVLVAMAFYVLSAVGGWRGRESGKKVALKPSITVS